MFDIISTWPGFFVTVALVLFAIALAFSKFDQSNDRRSRKQEQSEH